MEHERYLGIDIGGTTTKACLAAKNGGRTPTISLPTPTLEEPADQVAFARAVLDRLSEDERPDIAGVGLAVPGAVAPDGRLTLMPNAHVELVGLARAFRAATDNAPVATLNDANAAALGEAWLGAARGERNVLLVTLGTGIGAGIIVDGALLVGAQGAAGEIGHLTVVPGGHRCGCGGRGCLEQYASARGLVRLMREEAAKTRGEGHAAAAPDPRHDADALAVFEACAAGDGAAAAAVYRFCDALAQALRQVACVIDPDIILVGGGMTGSFDVFGNALQRSFHARALTTSAEVSIAPAALGNGAGAIGAARFAMIRA